MSYTTRSDALKQVCPRCHVEAGQPCVGARGKLRESVHRERTYAAVQANGREIDALTIGGDGLLTAEDGSVLGRLIAIEVERGGGGTYGGGLGERRSPQPSAVVEVQTSLQVGEGVGEPTEDGSRLFDTPDVSREVFDFYRTTVPGKTNSRYTAEAKRLIAKALEVRPADTLQQAIRGLAASPHHTENGYTALKYAIGRVKQSETAADRIDMMAAKAPGANARTSVQAKLDALAPAMRAVAADRMAKVRRMYRNRDHEPSQRQGYEAAELLKRTPGIVAVTSADGTFDHWETA